MLASGLVLLLLPACDGQEPAPLAPPPSGAVSAATPEATAIGIRVLAMGGNAVDAAVAVSLMLGATEPSESGLGGSVVMLVTPPGGREPVVMHAPPEPIGPYLRPTAVPVLAAAFKKYGSRKLTWEQLVEPARRVAEGGYAIGRFRHLMIVKEYRRIQGDSVAAALLLNPDHSIPGEGVRVASPALAATLARVASAGDDPGGELAGLLGEDLTGLVDPGIARALAAVPTVREDAPLRASYRGWTVLVAGDPYGGGRLVRALGMLETAPLAVLRKAGESRTAWLAESLAYAVASSEGTVSAYLATVPPLPLAVMDSALRRAAVAPRRAAAPSAPATTAPSAASGADTIGNDGTGTETSHFSIVDASGMAVSVTQTLGGPFGARATRLGFFLARAPVAGATPLTGLDPWSEPNGWSVPTVLARGDSVGLVLGSAGGPRAVSAVLQTITEWVDAGDPITRAVSNPRLHVEADTGARPRLILEGVVTIDPGGAPPGSLAPWGEAVRQVAAQRGLAIGEWDTGIQYLGISPFFGGVNAIARVGSEWAAAADPRRDGVGRVLSEEDVLRAEQDPDGEGDLLDPGEPKQPELPRGL